jgi:hypothetical protein
MTSLLHKLNINRILISGLVLLCLLGTQYAGLVHQYSHSAQANNLHAEPTPKENQVNDSFGHQASTKECQLFDGIALSGFLTSTIVALSFLNLYIQSYLNSELSIVSECASCPYSSRAPPQN